jgi:hypothetical protein
VVVSPSADDVYRVAIFAGPSLPPEDRLAFAGAHYFAPAKRGDVERAAAAFDAVLLIDGVFYGELATTPKEMLRACGSARVFGAASMGAIRAAECRDYGALPLGVISGWYARGVIEGDDEVAVLMHPETFAALSVPAVNVRYVARLGVRRGIIDGTQRDAWVAASRSIFYAERSWTAVLALAPPAARVALGGIARELGDLKRCDARFGVKRVSRLANERVRIA